MSTIRYLHPISTGIVSPTFTSFGFQPFCLLAITLKGTRFPLDAPLGGGPKNFQAAIDLPACIGCGLCVPTCPANAVTPVVSPVADTGSTSCFYT